MRKKSAQASVIELHRAAGYIIGRPSWVLKGLVTLRDREAFAWAD